MKKFFDKNINNNPEIEDEPLQSSTVMRVGSSLLEESLKEGSMDRAADKR